MTPRLCPGFGKEHQPAHGIHEGIDGVFREMSGTYGRGWQECETAVPPHRAQRHVLDDRYNQAPSQPCREASTEGEIEMIEDIVEPCRSPGSRVQSIGGKIRLADGGPVQPPLPGRGGLRYKVLIGRSLRAWTLPTQQVEAVVGYKVMNVMTSLGMPVTRKVG